MRFRPVLPRLLLALLSLAPFAASAGSPEPAAIVKSIYGKRDPYGAAVALQIVSRDRRALSNRLAELWKRAGGDSADEGEPPPGFDVTTNSQGMDVASARVALERQEAEHATVVARLTARTPWLRHSPAENVVRYDFVREHGAWKIDDVRSHDRNKEWSLRGLLIQAHESLESLKK